MNADFDYVTAVYRQEPDPDYAGNIFVEALPGLFSRRELTQALTMVPQVSDDERNGSVEFRLSRLGSVSKLCIPLSRVIDLACSMQRLLFEGYRNRRPFTPSDQLNRQRLYAMQQGGSVQKAGNHHPASQLSMALFGNPGSGKSFIMRQIANLFPPVIFHEESGLWQVPFLFVEMPYDGKSEYTLAAQIFLALEKLMPGSEYTRHYTENVKLNAERLLMKALDIAYDLGVGMIVVDEAQNSRATGNQQVASIRPRGAPRKASEGGLKKLLITASNLGHMPLMFTGTMELMPTLLTRASPARRMVGRGSAVWSPLSRDKPKEAPASEFDLFMSVLFRCQWLKEPVRFDQDWSDIFFAYTQGVPDYMVKLFESSQALAIRSGKTCMTIEHVTATFSSEFQAGEATLNALQNPDDTALLLMPDVFGCEPQGLTSQSANLIAPMKQPAMKAPKTQEDIVAEINKHKDANAARSGKGKSKLSPKAMSIDTADIVGSDLRRSGVVPANPLATKTTGA
jgi:hypothetical protein